MTLPSRRVVFVVTALIVVAAFVIVPSLWRSYNQAQIVAAGGRESAVVLAVEPADESNSAGSRWRYTLEVRPSNATPYRVTTEIDDYLVPGDTVVTVAIDPKDSQSVVIIP